MWPGCSLSQVSVMCQILTSICDMWITVLMFNAQTNKNYETLPVIQVNTISTFQDNAPELAINFLLSGSRM